MSAIDTLASLNGLDVRALEPLQRVLLVTDGTLTEILEAAFMERVELVKLAQQTSLAIGTEPLIEATPGETLIERRILLRGRDSGRNYAYAESLIAIDRLGASFRDELFESNVPLGRLWLEHKMETFREILTVRRQAAGDLSRHFGCTPMSPLLSRTYRVLVAKRPAMIITEHFPTHYNGPIRTV